MKNVKRKTQAIEDERKRKTKNEKRKTKHANEKRKTKGKNRRYRKLNVIIVIDRHNGCIVIRISLYIVTAIYSTLVLVHLGKQCHGPGHNNKRFGHGCTIYNVNKGRMFIQFLKCTSLLYRLANTIFCSKMHK